MNGDGVMPARRLLAVTTVTALVLVAAWMVALPAVAGASAACGDGVVEGGEECDGGPGGFFVDGDPARGSCVTGSRCYFRFTCCKFNCQYVGTPDAPCQDGNVCTGPDTCDQIGVCHRGPNVPNGTSCEDGLFCDGTESCQGGVCAASTGNPCAETACVQCQEDRRSCFKPQGAQCSDGSTCVQGGTCDGAGICRDGEFREGPCDDGLYCNGTDVCGAGACSVHSGDPCTGPDGDGNCEESCDETLDSCTAADPDGVSCDDGIFCDGPDDTCSAGLCTGTGTAGCDDLNSCTIDGCDEGNDTCTHTVLVDGVSCEDDNLCTRGDLCADGQCVGLQLLMRELCPWTIVLRERPDSDVIRTGFESAIDGDTCGGTLMLGGRTRIVSDLVSGVATDGSPLRIAADSVIGANIASAGGGARAFPSSGFLPYVLPEVSTLAPGSLAPRSDGAGFYDLTNNSELASDCIAARTSYAAIAAALDLLPLTEDSIAAIRIPAGQTLTIPASVVGGLNVIDVDGSIKAGVDSVLELDGGGDAGTVMVLRISGRVKMQIRSTLSLSGGLTPQHTLVYVRDGSCQFSDLTLGAGTLLCSPGRVRIGHTAAWIGAVYADGRVMQIGDKASFHYTPFRGF